MTLLPSSLRWRTLLVVFGAVLIAQLITYAAFVGEYRRAVISGKVALVARHVHLLQDAMTASADADHSGLLAGLMQPTGMRARISDVPPSGETDTSAYSISATESLRAQLGKGVLIRATREEAGLTVSVGFESAGQRRWLVLDRPTTMPWRLLLLLAAIIGAVLTLSGSLICTMQRPLRSLNEAVRAFGSGESRPVTPEGPREIREIAYGFNAMVEQIEANDRERNVMLAGLPHDLRTPISRLRVRTELLDDEEAKEGIRRDVRDIEHIAEQFVQYVRGFDPSSAPREAVDLAALAAERVGRWVSSGNDVRLSGSSVGLVIPGDAIALVRLIDNLIGNAVQHGSPPIELEIVRGAAEGVSLVVRDHGSGIPYEEQSRALEPFTKVCSARGTKGSVGLGLAIVTRVARSHGGEVQLRNLGPAGFEVNVTFAPPAAQA